MTPVSNDNSTCAARSQFCLRIEGQTDTDNGCGVNPTLLCGSALMLTRCCERLIEYGLDFSPGPIDPLHAWMLFQG